MFLKYQSSRNQQRYKNLTQSLLVLYPAESTNTDTLGHICTFWLSVVLINLCGVFFPRYLVLSFTWLN